jgi:hypothetical protein
MSVIVGVAPYRPLRQYNLIVTAGDPLDTNLPRVSAEP